MPWWRWRRRIPWLLFALCLALAAGLTGLVVLAPWLDTGGPVDDPVGRTLALFSRDHVVRRTAGGAALGLVATAFIFFRPPYSRPPRAPSDVIGA
jgi:hypothetical protein